MPDVTTSYGAHLNFEASIKCLLNLFVLLFKYVPTIFETSRKNGPRPIWTVYKHESDKNKK